MCALAYVYLCWLQSFTWHVLLYVSWLVCFWRCFCVWMCVWGGLCHFMKVIFCLSGKMPPMSCNPAGCSEGSGVVLSANQSYSSAPPQRLIHKTALSLGCLNVILCTETNWQMRTQHKCTNEDACIFIRLRMCIDKWTPPHTHVIYRLKGFSCLLSCQCTA